MNARTIRRAQERKALKAARQESQNHQPSHHQQLQHHHGPQHPANTTAHETPTKPTPPSEALDWTHPSELAAKRAAFSEARLKANRANSRLSTGPSTQTGKAASSKNALKTGLTGRTVLLASDDAVLYEAHLNRFFTTWSPATDRETELVQTLADTQWRINRIPALEFGIYALARIEFAGQFENLEPAEAAALIQAQAYITYHRQINNLNVQETRLRRQYQNTLKELVQLVEERESQHAPETGIPRPPAFSKPAPPVFAAPACTSQTDFGFEFSTPLPPACGPQANAPAAAA